MTAITLVQFNDRVRELAPGISVSLVAAAAATFLSEHYGAPVMLFALLLGRRLFQLVANRMSPGFWLNACATLIILLGQSVQDSAAGKDVYKAFAIRMGLFILVTLYACAAVYLIDLRSKSSSEETPCS